MTLKDYFLGVKECLALAQALLVDPKIVVLDEPINGLDRQGIIDFQELITKIHKEIIQPLISHRIYLVN